MKNLFLEIKNRFLLSIVTFLSIFLTVYYYKAFLLILIVVSNTILSKDILKYFIFTSITEMFTIYITLDVFLTTIILYFVTVYQLICFLGPGLFRHEYIFLQKTFFASILLGILSICFFQTQLLPIVLNFFLSFQNYSFKTINFYFEAKIYDYLFFYKDLYLSCFFVFQSCIVLILLANYISNNLILLQTVRKFFYIIILLFSTVLTPPDVISQISLFLSITFVFEISVFLNILKSFSN